MGGAPHAKVKQNYCSSTVRWAEHRVLKLSARISRTCSHTSIPLFSRYRSRNLQEDPPSSRGFVSRAFRRKFGRGSHAEPMCGVSEVRLYVCDTGDPFQHGGLVICHTRLRRLTTSVFDHRQPKEGRAGAANAARSVHLQPPPALANLHGPSCFCGAGDTAYRSSACPR